jgi:hypothetical protein
MNIVSVALFVSSVAVLGLVIGQGQLWRRLRRLEAVNTVEVCSAIAKAEVADTTARLRGAGFSVVGSAASYADQSHGMRRAGSNGVIVVEK